MKRLRSLFIALSLCASVAMLVPTGCVTKPDGTSGLDVNRVARLAGSAAQLGSQAWLAAHPDQRPYFIATVAALRGLSESKNYDPAAFAEALQSLPMNELRGPEGSIYISAAIVVWDEAIASASALDQQVLVAAVLAEVIKGLDRTLGTAPPGAQLSEPGQPELVLGDPASGRDVLALLNSP